MNSQIRDVLAVVCAILLLGLLYTFLTQLRPIQVSLPQLNKEELVAKQEIQQKHAKTVETHNKIRRVYACETDEDCIIVDKDPCGCLVGPAGVTAINAMYTLEFDQLTNKSVTTTCPDTAPSPDKECSATATPVCKAQKCQIVY